MNSFNPFIEVTFNPGVLAYDAKVFKEVEVAEVDDGTVGLLEAEVLDFFILADDGHLLFDCWAVEEGFKEQIGANSVEGLIVPELRTVHVLCVYVDTPRNRIRVSKS